MNGLFKVKYDLKRSWYDPNLKFLHLNEKKQNFISAETQKKIWTPYFVFFNIESEERIEKSDKKPIIYVEPNPSFVYETTGKANLIITNEYEIAIVFILMGFTEIFIYMIFIILNVSIELTEESTSLSRKK